MESITTLRAALDSLEESIAESIEHAMSETAHATWSQGIQYERSRVLALIDYQLDTLNRGGMNATALQTLKRMIADA